SLRAGRRVQTALIRASGARNEGVLFRSDLTGFNWADVPAVLVETGFMTNPTESRRLKTSAYQQRVALGLVHGGAAALDVRLVHRRLRRGGFLVLLLGDRARLVELAPQLVGTRIVCRCR